ncbi:MAG: heliorhodopsin HeR [Thermoleophilia bacterium]|jgi:hypothetical protein|nr:heliorhodopsin HeR [Thermoleophilia bacterium]
MTDAPDPAMQRRLGALRWWNIIIGLILAAQAVVMGILMKDFSIDVTATYMTGPPGSPQELIEVFGLPIGWGVLSFVIISAAALLLMGTVAYGWYTRNLLQSRNYGRWIEYFFSSSIMIVLIAMLTGITEIVALLAIFGVNASMILFGLLQEKYERPGSGNWLPFLFGSFAGIIPWIGVALYVWAPGSASDVSPPGFVYGIIITLFLFFNVFAINMLLQYKKVGPWRDYLFGEKVYVLLSLTAKSALAWQVFFPVLMD